MSYLADTSKEFKDWVHELEKFPKIETFCVNDDKGKPILNNGKAMVAKEFKLQSENLGEVEQYLMNQCNEYMEDKHVWIRVMPAIKQYAEENIMQYTDEYILEGKAIYIGRARIVAEDILT